jgi:hypothetical protein
VIAAAVTAAFAAVRRRSRAKTAVPAPSARGVPAPSDRAVPAQRRSEIDQLGLGVEELVVADHEAQDARLFDALSGGDVTISRSPGC